MYPYINLGFAHVGTFGLMLWLAAVCGVIVLHKNFVRNGVDADALNVVTMVVIAGIIGAKLWHELENVKDLEAAWRLILMPGWRHPGEVVVGFLQWFQAGFAWFGGLLAGVAMLMYQGHAAHPNHLQGHRAALRMLDLAAPAAAIGYGVGRIGCLTSGDGDYGMNTTLPWGVHMANGVDRYHQALVLPNPPNALVQPTPLYEFLFAIALAIWLWKRGSKPLPLGFLTGEYLMLSGIGRFLVEFVRINPRLYWGMSNAQVAALGSIVFGGAMMYVTRTNTAVEADAPLKRSKGAVATV
jgi:phosphatidylglycerol:prolipoprotein diacylglycerol transferase